MQSRVIGLLALLAALLSGGIAPAPRPAAAGSGVTWTVDRPSEDGVDGDAATHSGSIRFVLERAQPGDTVRIGDIGPADAVFVTKTLVVGPGVSLGRTRDEPCGAANRPLLNIEALPGLSSGPIMSLGAGATLRNITLSNAAITGPRVALKLIGADTDVCAVAFGQAYDPDGSPLEVAAPILALGIDGPHASIHRSLIKGGIVVGVTGDDARIGDAIGGSGEANSDLLGAAVTILADATDAAQRVTVRDPFPRGLSGLVGAGVSGGDALPTHANHWALTPSISSAARSGSPAVVEVLGVASPHSLVDIYFLVGGVISRQAPVNANAGGAFSFSGPVPDGNVSVLAGSTLNDQAYPARIGSSSALSEPMAVQAASQGEPLLSAVGSVANLSRPGSADARPGERIRLTVRLESVGTASVQQIAGANLQTVSAVAVEAGSGALTGGSGFLVSDVGFSGGTLAVGNSATFTLDATVTTTQVGSVIFTLEVRGSGIVAIPVVGRLRLVAAPIDAPRSPRVWLPLLAR